MRAALIVNLVTSDREANLARIVSSAESAAAEGAELVVLPEAAATGLIIRDDLSHDLPLGQPIPGPLTDELGGFVRRARVHLAIGVLERAGDALYDSALLLDPAGEIVLHYRRIQPQWHGRAADPDVYREGDSVAGADTALGRFATIICGDLFDEDVLTQVRAVDPDWLLFPFARCFSDGSYDAARWESEEMPEYLAQIREAGRPTLMVNYLSEPELDGYFGGAAVVSGGGRVIASLPIGRAGTLLVDLERPRQ